MNPVDCPIPLVAEALAPFIKTRDEVTSIRQTLQDFLYDQLAQSEQAVSYLNLTSARPIPGDTGLSSLSGVRLAYRKALQAHEAARASYTALKNELELLKPNREDISNGLSALETNLHHDYLPLIRQREKSRRLKVIERTIAKIIESGSQGANLHLDEVVKRHLGDLPSPPTSQNLSSTGRDSNVDSLILGLKKAIIASKRRIDEHKTRQELDQDYTADAVTSQAEVIGLQRALHELTSWMETQLSVIAETDSGGSASARSASANDSRDTPTMTSQSPSEDISVLYDDYLAARESLVEILQEVPHQSTISDTELAHIFESNGTTNEPTAVPKTSAEVLIPHIATLAQMRQEEQSLLQSVSYIRQQITNSEAAATSVIRKLSDESHLVLPGASTGHEWARVTTESTRNINNHVETQVREGLSAATNATKALEAIQRLPGSLESLSNLT